MHIVAPALKAVGVDVDELTLCTTSLYEARKDVRCSIGQDVRNTFSPGTPLVAHFDGKLLPDCDGVNADRLPIVVSGKMWRNCWPFQSYQDLELDVSWA